MSEARTCGWSGCDTMVTGINSRTRKPFYYCPEHMQARKPHKLRHYAKTSTKHNCDMLERYHALRRRVIEMYGNCCACCSESMFEFLTIDHVQGEGNTHRRKRGGNYGVYKDSLSSYQPNKFHVLCYNCNCARQYHGVCPHQQMSGKSEGEL